MKKIIKISLIVVVAALLVFGGVKLYDRFAPLYEALRYSEEDLKKKVKSAKEFIEEETGLDLRELNDEEKESIEKGTETARDVYERIIKEAIEKAKKEAKDTKKQEEKNKYDPNEVAAPYLAEIFALESEYEQTITSMIAQAREEYYHMRIEEKVGKEEAIHRTTTKYGELINIHEGQCDEKVNSILSRMEEDLKSKNCETTLVEAARKAYDGEKNSKRAYYMKLLIGN